MARPRKYEFGTENICLSLKKVALEVLRANHQKINMNQKISFSAYVSFLLENLIENDTEYASVMAKYHNRQFYYWKNEKERLLSEREEGI